MEGRARARAHTHGLTLRLSELDKSVKEISYPLMYEMTGQVGRCYLLSEVVILVMRHAGGDVVNHLSSGGGIVRCSLACTAISLQTSHEATVSCKVDLQDHVTTGTSIYGNC